MKINSPLDMWSPQQKGEEIFLTLDSINNDDTVILFTNIESDFRVGDYSVEQKFKLCIWVRGKIKEPERVEKQGRLIIILEDAPFTEEVKVSDDFIIHKGTKIDKELLEKILKAKDIEYIKLESKKKSENKPIYKLNREIWFIRNIEVLESSFSDKTAKTVKIYPDVKSKLTLKYYENEETGYLIDQRDFVCLIEFNNLLAILVSPTLSEIDKYYTKPDNLGYKPVTIEDVKKLLTEKGFEVEVISGKPNIKIESRINNF